MVELKRRGGRWTSREGGREGEIVKSEGREGGQKEGVG